jgi:hypothetical protein
MRKSTDDKHDMTTTPPRRKWHIARWLFVLALVTLAWGGWRAHTFRSALAQAKALGWTVAYTDPFEVIRKNWKAAFGKPTWQEGITYMNIPTSGVFEQNVAIVHRLNPERLQIDNATTLRDLSALKPLTRLQGVQLTGCAGLSDVDALKHLTSLQRVYLTGCTALANVDALKNLSSLRTLTLLGCTALTNVDAIKNLSDLEEISLSSDKGLTNVDALTTLPALHQVDLFGCTGLTKESITALKAALPQAEIHSDYE